MSPREGKVLPSEDSLRIPAPHTFTDIAEKGAGRKILLRQLNFRFGLGPAICCAYHE
jgi:hypothetical protein